MGDEWLKSVETCLKEGGFPAEAGYPARKAAALTRTVAEAAAAHGTNAEFIWESECPAVMNDAALVEELRSVLPELAEAQPTLAGEDFARYQELAPGVLVWLGTGDTPPLHNSRFFVPEELLEKGVEMWQRIAAHEWKK